MRTMIGIAAAAVLACVSTGMAQDVPSLIEKLKSKDVDEADNAREDLLKQGAKAVAPLREAAAKAADAAFKKSAAAVADRLETRQAAAGLAKSWGDRWFSIFVNGVHLGWVHMKAEEKDGKIVFEDEIRAQQGKDASLQIKATLTCDPNEYLTARTIVLDLATPENTVVATAQLKENRLVVKAGGEVKAHKVQANTVVDLAVFPLVTILPKTEGYDVEVLELIKPKLPEAAVLKFDKEETVEFENRKVKARRFMLAGDGKERFYWVDATGRLLKVQFSGDDNKDVEITLTDEKRAKDIDTKD
jgi:hypothetical protein